MAAITAFVHRLQGERGLSSLFLALPDLPTADAASTAQWTLDVLQGRCAAPASVLLQADHLVRWRGVLLNSEAAPEPKPKQRACA